MTLRPGLCSVTLRALDPATIAMSAAAAGLDVIEWGGDVHVPPGDLARARRVAAVTADAGLTSCSVGSYFRAEPGEVIAPVLDVAQELGADRVRVWAGTLGSAEADDGYRAAVTRGLLAAAEAASARGIGLALEFHGGTLADSAKATLRLLADVGHPALSTYWQPPQGLADADAIGEYERVAPVAVALHVFSWWPRNERRRLHERERLWRQVLARAAASPHPPRDALLEFVQGDDPALVPAEAATLRRLLAEIKRAEPVSTASPLIAT